MSGWKYAFSISKQELAISEPPGTVNLIEHELSRTTSGRDQQEDHIQKVPQPSSSPADPLNWPTWRKLSVLTVMSIWAFVVNFGAASIAPALPLLEFQMLPPQPFTKLSHLVAVNNLLIGLSNIFWVPLGNTFGRRPVIIVSMLLSLFCCMWGGLAKTFNSLLAARAMQGVGFGPADTIAPDVIGEIYFVHERGRAIALYTIFLAGGSFAGGVAGSYIAGRFGYQYIFWIDVAILGAVLLGEIFLVPETLFNRDAHLPKDAHGTDVQQEKTSVGMSERAVYADERFTFAQSLKVGVYRGHLIKNFLGPWLSLAFPGTWVVMLQYGGLVGGIVTISTIGPQFLAAPPYLWGNNVGLLNVGAIVGGVLGFIATYFTADFLLNRRAKRQREGLAEPESRLPAMFPALFLATTGFWTFGWSAANPSPHAWAGMVVGYGMVGFGLVQVPAIGFNYLIDAYNSISSDCFVITSIFRAVVGFAWTYFVGTWVERDGAALPFGIFGMLMGVFSLLVLPLWLFGKRTRIATAGYLPKETHH